MTPLDYLSDVPFECSPGDANVAAFTEAASLIGGRDAVEEFLACGIWPLNEKCDFDVERKETPLSKVVVPMSKITPVIGTKESEAAFETWIVHVANLLVGKYNVAEHNAYMGLHYGWLNRIFELASVLFQPRLKPIARAPRKRKTAAAAPTPTSKATEK
jgi:hypothetical protein